MRIKGGFKSNKRSHSAGVSIEDPPAIPRERNARYSAEGSRLRETAEHRNLTKQRSTKYFLIFLLTQMSLFAKIKQLDSFNINYPHWA